MAEHEATPARQVRAARNEALFRDVNERVSELATTFVSGAPASRWVCECSDVACADTVELTRDEYEQVRSDGAWFVVVPSAEHVVVDVEAVVTRHERYWVVEKTGLANVVAEGLDPRS